MHIAILCISAVAICTGRVEAKLKLAGDVEYVNVAICTGRVEAKNMAKYAQSQDRSCNLHGACGGKESFGLQPFWHMPVAICTGRVEAKRFRLLERLRAAVAICTGRVEAKASYIVVMLVKFVAICTGRVEDLASSPEKNLRKFMQTYCIFIHLGV